MSIDIYLMYAYVGILSMLVIGIILNRVLSTKFKEVIDRRLVRVLIFLIVFCFVDVAWGVIGSLISGVNRIIYLVASYAFHIMAAGASFVVSNYCVNYMVQDKSIKNMMNVSRVVLLAIQAIVLFQNIFTNLCFIVDESGAYHSGMLRPLMFGLQFVHYFIVIGFALFLLAKDKEGRNKRVYLTSMLFAVVTLVFGILQMLYPDAPFYSMGFLFTSVVIYAFTLTNQREEYMQQYYVAQEHERSRSRIEEALEKAEAANQAKTVFLSNMSHDIRTPINGIMGMVTLAKMEQLSPEVEGYVNKIDGASHHLLSLINDVLDMSRIESGRVEISHESMNVCMVADNCYSIVAGSLQNRDIDFQVNTNNVEHKRVLGDELHLKQVLINILGNAVKFTPDGGRIIFNVSEVSRAEDIVTVRFFIKDNGIGMSEEFLPHLFDAFAQEEQGARGQYKGTGLGMPITKQFTELMGGTVSVESKLHEGTAFTVDIPFKIDHSGASEIKAVYKDHLEVEGLRVLLVEDNELNQEIAVLLLEDEGVVVTTADNGRIAYETFINNPPDTFQVILMDIMMPEMNGYEATMAIRAYDREDAKTIPIIAMTANAFDEDKKRAMEAGMNAHVAKPINFQLLLKELNKFV